MITSNTPITPKHKSYEEANALASTIMREVHPRDGLVTFFALGQHQLLTALILHAAHTKRNTSLRAVAREITGKQPTTLASEITNSPSKDACAIWNDTLTRCSSFAGAALLLNLGVQMIAIEQRMAA